MLKRSLAVILLAVLSAGLQAQPRLARAEIYAGVQGGVAGSMVNFSPVVTGTDNVLATASLGGNGGLVFRYNGHKYCGLQAEVNYMHRGWRETEDSLNIRYRRDLHYVEVPFLVHLYFGSDRHRLFINAGPQVGYCFYDSSSGSGHPSETEQYKPLVGRFDYGIAAGLGYTMRTRSIGSFQVEARFDYCFSDLFDNRKRSYFAQSHPMDLTLNIGYLWEFKSKSKSYK